MYDSCKAHCRLMLILMLACLTAGCTHQRRRTLLETIPVASSVIVRSDADRLLKMAGCRSRNGSITLTADIEALLQHDAQALSLLSECARLGSELDLTGLYAFCYDSCWVVTAPMKEGAQALLQGDSFKVGSLGRASGMHFGSVSVLATQTQAWLACCHGDTLAERLSAIINAADRASVSQYAPVAKFLPNPEALAAGYLALPSARNPLGHDFDALLVSVDGTDRQLTANVRMTRNGCVVNAADSLQPIDDEALAYMPGGAIASFAIGLDKDAIARLMSWARRLPLASQLVVNAISALADPDGGTMALGVAPGGSAETIRSLSVDNWLFKAVLPIEDKSADIANIINHVLNDKLYSESDSAYLAITNYDPEFYPSDHTVATMPGALMQARLAIGYRSQVMKAIGLTSGYMFEAWVSDSLLRASVNVQGPSQYLLPSLLRDLGGIVK